MQPLQPARKPRARSAGVLAWVVAIIVIAAAGMVGGGWATRYLIRTGHWTTGENNDTAADEDESEQWYTCGMHPNVLQKGPGDCPICQMKLTPRKENSDEGADDRERKILYWRAPMDPNFISQEPGQSPMGMDLVPVYADASQSATGNTISVPGEMIQTMGIRTTVVVRGPLVKTIRTVGRVDYDERTVTFINTKFDGYIEKLYADQTGMQVEKGQPLFDVYSPKLYSAQTEYLVGLRGVEDMAKSTLPGMLQAAERTLDASQTQLKYFDVSDEQIDRLGRTKEIQKNLTIHSPARGIVTEKMALQGMYVKPGMRLYTIADLSHVWVYVDIYEYQLPWVRVGQQARMTLPYIPGREFSGQVVYIYPYLEKQSRVIKVRLEFENPSLELKPEMYANVILEADLKRDALLIPREAFIDSGTRKVTFVSLGKGRFQPRDIQVGVETESGLVEVLYGLDAGDTIVTSGQFLLDAESKLREAVAKMMAAQKSDEVTERRSNEGGDAHSHDDVGQGIPEDAKFACPMDKHPDESDPANQGAYFSAEEGRCPLCGMALKPLTDLDWAQARASDESEHANHGVPQDAKYACPMETHPDENDAENQGAYFASAPGKCPRCGMAVKPLEDLSWVQARIAGGDADLGYTCPDHPHIFSGQSGECPRCGNELQAFKVMYACPDPEHSRVVSAAAGACPHCSRELAPYRGVWLAPAMADHNMPPKPGVADSAKYRCATHPLVHSEKAGRCTICASNLQQARERPAAQLPITADGEFVCPMHPEQIKSMKSGVCAMCGMRLVHIDMLPKPTSAPAAFAVQMDYLMEHYLEIQMRFASDRTADVAMHALALVAATDEFAKLLDDPGVDLPAELPAAVSRLRAAALKTNGKSLDADRVTFVELSGAMRSLIGHVRPNKGKYPDIFIFHCPMSKGDWLQTSEDMANPYYGFKMLKCGDLISRD